MNQEQAEYKTQEWYHENMDRYPCGAYVGGCPGVPHPKYPHVTVIPTRCIECDFRAKVTIPVEAAEERAKPRKGRKYWKREAKDLRRSLRLTERDLRDCEKEVDCSAEIEANLREQLRATQELLAIREEQLQDELREHDDDKHKLDEIRRICDKFAMADIIKSPNSYDIMMMITEIVKSEVNDNPI